MYQRKMMTFKKRYLSEETEQTISNEIDRATDYTKNNDAKPQVDQTPDIAKVASVSATVPLVRSVENINDVDGDRSPDTAKQAGETMAREARKAAKQSSRTPFNVDITESEDVFNRFRGPHYNKLTRKLKGVGLNVGFEKKDIAPNSTNSKAGQKNINSGTQASFTMGKKDPGRHAKDNLNTAQNIPGKEDIKKTMTMDSTYFEVNRKIEALLEYSDMDVKWGMNAPGNRNRAVYGVDDGSRDRTSDTHDMVKNMNAVVDDKAKIQAKNRAATMPEPDKNHAMEQTAGLHMQRSNTVHQADGANADVRQQREQRMQQKAEQDQQNG